MPEVPTHLHNVATLTPAAVRKQIANGDTDPVYLLQGEDDVERSALASQFADLVEEGLRAFNVETIHAGEMTSGDRIAEGVGSLVAAVRTLPMMAPRRVVVVAQAEALLAPKRESEAAARALERARGAAREARAADDARLRGGRARQAHEMFKLLGKHATIVDCGSPADVAGAERWVRARVTAAGVEIDPAGARALATLAGFPDRPRNDGKTGDVKRLRGEVDRLLLYALGQKKISLDDVREVAGPAALQDDWAMANAIEAGQGGEALRQLSLIFDAGAPPEKILGQLGWLVRSKFPQVAPRSFPAPLNRCFGRTSTSSGRAAIRACCSSGWSSSCARESERGPDSVRGVGDDGPAARSAGVGCDAAVQPRLVAAGGVPVDDALVRHLVDERNRLLEGRLRRGEVLAVDGGADVLQRTAKVRPVLAVAVAVLETLPVRLECGCMRSHVNSSLRNH